MTETDDRAQSELREGRAPWPDPPGNPFSPLSESLSCDVLVVGAGITGALAGQHLAERGCDVVIIDREEASNGSTAASTAMLQWEIDTPLGELAELYGFARAAAVYRISFRAVAGLKALVGRLAFDGALRERSSLYLAAGEVGAADLLEEHGLRSRAGLPGDFVGYEDLRRVFAIDRAAAVLSPGSAEADPVLLSRGLLADARRRGARILKADAVAFDHGSRSVVAALGDGKEIEAGHVVLATGYAMPPFVSSDLHRIASSWAIATAPVDPDRLWRNGSLIWEASRDYHYLRTTRDHRIIVGGEDEEMDDSQARRERMPAKRERLATVLEEIWPHAPCRVERVWSGAFGQTTDGLPLIGPAPGMPRIHAAYGYGGNGITFSFLASRMIAEMIAGRTRGWHEFFAIDRLDPRA